MQQSSQRVPHRCSRRHFGRSRIHAQAENLLLGAQQVHSALCAPPYLNIGNFEIASATIAARHVPGDFITTFEKNGACFLALGDLMGKGLSAAMWLTHVLDLLQRATEQSREVPEIMRRLNQEMHGSRVGVPLTSLFLARLDPKQSKLTYSCGGCPPGFLLGLDSRVEILEQGGPILGAVQDAIYVSADLEFNPNDTLLVGSDGVIEVHNGTSFELRPDRVVKHLQSTAGQSAHSIVELLLKRVRENTPVLTDDVSLLAVKRTR